MKKSKREAEDKQNKIHPVARTMLVLLTGIILSSTGMALVFVANWVGMIFVIIGFFLILSVIIIPKLEKKTSIHDKFLEISAFGFGVIAISIAVYISFSTASLWEIESHTTPQFAIAAFLLLFYIFGAAIVYEAIKKLRCDRI